MPIGPFEDFDECVREMTGKVDDPEAYCGWLEQHGGKAMERKALRLEAKDIEDSGQFVARFATLNEPDKDGDVTLPGAFPDGKRVLVSAYGHTSWEGAMPTGEATIREVGDEAIAEGTFWLDTPQGDAAHKTVKRAAGLQEWSYGYLPTEFSFGDMDGQQVRYLKKLDVFEVSPVLVGAGNDTATLAIKSVNLPFVDHIEETRKAAEALRDRVRDRKSFRAQEGRDLSQSNRERLDELAEALAETAEGLKALLHEGGEAKDEALRLHVEYERIKSIINGGGYANAPRT